jgi:Peptidase family M1 domain
MHRFVQEDVHDFAWTSSPDMIEQRRRFERPGLPPVDMRLLLQPEHEGQAARHFAATEACLRDYGEWFGAYPYGHVTIVDPAWQSAAEGMEYPTLFTAGTRWLVRPGVTEPEDVTVHECGHQFWYGIVGNNEFEHAWMDEGLTTFSTARVIDRAFTPHFESDRFFGDFVPWVYRDVPLSRETDGNRLTGYRPAAESDAPSTPSWRYFPGTGGAITYNKTALWLNSLERIIGWPRLQRGMSTYFARWAFRHPSPRDFFSALEEAAGRDLGPFFDETYRSANEVDYGVQQFSSERARVSGFIDRSGTKAVVTDASIAKPDVFVTELVVRRYGEAVLPVDVLVTFADGRQERERWDGRDRWRLYRWERTARAVTAQVDPGRTLLLDVNMTNNSWTLEPQAREAARKWSAHWLVWLQDALLTWASLV